MKVISLLLIIFAGFFVSCKGIIEEPTPVILQPEILQAIANPAIVKYNGSSTVTWQLKNAKYCEVSVNGVIQSTSGCSINLQNLIAPPTIVITAIGDGSLKSSTTVTIPVEDAPKPSLVITAPTSLISYAGTATISWTLGEFTTNVSIDGVPQTGASFKTPVLLNSKDYTLVAAGPGGIQSYKVTINVESWENSKLGLITYKPWYLVKSEKRNLTPTTSEWYNMIPEPRMFTDHLVFGVDGKLREYDVNEIVFGGPYDWYFTESGLQVVKGTTYTSVTVTKDTLILVCTLLGFGTTSEMRETYSHK